MSGKVGIAGEVKGTSAAGAYFGVSGLSTRKNTRTATAAIAGLDRPGYAKVGAAGVNTRPLVEASTSAAGIDAFYQRDQQLAALSQGSNRLGDRAARDAWQRGVWFADFTYITTPFQPEGPNGGYVDTGQVGWRNGRELTFGRENRVLPLFIDSAGYRRELTATAPQWAMDFDTYAQAIELIEPEGYAAWDYPTDKQRSLESLRALMALYPNDDRLWPVFSIRWTWNKRAHLDFAKLPGWASRSLAGMIPLTRTQRSFKETTREQWARQAIANALVMAADPDFRWMAETFGKVMIGGMVNCELNRMARHVFTAVLCELFPETEFWLLGQANFAVINGLGKLGLLDRVWTDGTWWIKDATAERFAYVENGLITMMSLESSKRGKDGKRQVQRQTFFTLVEMMAANLRSLLAAYEGLWAWPPPEPLPLDLVDVAQAQEMKSRLQAAQMELGL